MNRNLLEIKIPEGREEVGAKGGKGDPTLREVVCLIGQKAQKIHLVKIETMKAKAMDV